MLKKVFDQLETYVQLEMFVQLEMYDLVEIFVPKVVVMYVPLQDSEAKMFAQLAEIMFDPQLEILDKAHLIMFVLLVKMVATDLIVVCDQVQMFVLQLEKAYDQKEDFSIVHVLQELLHHHQLLLPAMFVRLLDLQIEEP